MVPAMLADNLPHWNGITRPYYEVWFFKVNHRASGDALWVRYTTLAPRFAAESLRGELWAIHFDRAGGAHAAGRRVFPMAEVGLGQDPIIRLGTAELADGRARGALDAGGVGIAWDLRYEPNAGTYHHVPRMLRRVLSTAVCSPNVDLAMRGWFDVGGRRFECTGEPGQQGHIWGRKYGYRWSWGHCNAFAGAPGAVFEGVTAQVALGGFVTPHLTSLFVRWNGADHVLNGPAALLWTPSEHALGRWKFTADAGELRFAGKLTARTQDIVGVGYTDTDGSMVYCHNAKIGSMVLDISKNDGGRWRAVDRLEAAGTAALEFTERVAHPSVPVRAR